MTLTEVKDNPARLRHSGGDDDHSCCLCSDKRIFVRKQKRKV